MLTKFWLVNLKGIELRRLRRRLEDNIRTDHRKIGWEVMDWIHLAKDRDQWRALVDTEINLRLPKEAGDFLTS
jgi:hypothetical protein